MSGEVNLELYTIAMTRLNNGFAKMGEIIKDNTEVLNSEYNDENKKEILDKMAVRIKRTLSDFKKSCHEFRDFLEDVRADLDQEEINFNDFEPFLEHVQKTFPNYEKDLNSAMKGIKDSVGISTGKLDYVISDVEEVIDKIIVTFNEIYLLADNYFKNNKCESGC